MNFRPRLALGALTIAVIPIALLSVGVQREVERQLTADFTVRVSAAAEGAERSFAREHARVRARLHGLGVALARDNRFRRALAAPDSEDRRYVLDYGPDAMTLTGLDALRIQAGDGRVLSSGHYRNEFDRIESAVLDRLRSPASSAVLMPVRTADTTLLVLAAVDSVQLGSRLLYLTGGVVVDTGFLRAVAGEPLRATLTLSGGRADTAPPTANDFERHVVLPYIGPDGAAANAVVTVSHPTEPLDAVRARVRRWLVIAAAAAIGGAVLLAWWLAARLSKPLVTLAHKTAVLDLDRLDVEFASRRTDEVGRLARLLDGMVRRLRTSTARLREAERRATIADVARQVNHDIKNGLTPIRNVFRHLEQVARDDPDQLARVLSERRPTVDASVAYLYDLASNYARLTPGGVPSACDVNAVLREVAAERGGDVLTLRLGEHLPSVLGDRLALRRVFENLIGNAVESLGAGEGSVTVTTMRDGDTVRVSIADTGCGMPDDVLQRAFDDFYSTKDGGTGLGLSIVRRLVADLGASMRVDTEPGRGTTFVLTFPPHAAGTAVASP